MNNNLTSFKSALTKLLIATALLQVVFFCSLATLVVMLIVLFNWKIVRDYVLIDNNLTFYPLSTFVLVGYCMFFIIMPGPATLLEFKPIIYNLKNPIETFIHISLVFYVLLITHRIYRKIAKRNFLQQIFKKHNFFNPISESEVWVLSIAALAIVCINIIIYGRFEDSDNKPFWIQLLSPLGMFVNLPILFLFPCYKLVKKIDKLKYPLYVCITAVILFIVGIASNFRTQALLFLSLMAASLLFSYLLNIVKLKIKNRFVLIMFIAAWFFTGPFIDLSLSMVIVRGERVGISGMELLNKTLDVYNDKDKLRAYEKIMDEGEKAIRMNDWDERYLNNSILARFCSVKTIDETIYYAKRLGFADSKMYEEYKRLLIAIFPPIIYNAFGMTTNERDELKKYSVTDYLYAESTGDFSGLGSAKIGSIPGHGLSIFGYAYLLVIIPFFFILFFYFDSTVLIKNGHIHLSLWAFINLFFIFYITSAGHNFQTEIKYIIRGFFESIFFYLIFLFLIRKFGQIFLKK